MNWWIKKMDDQGWIKLHRKIQYNELWLSEKFTRSQAWIDLLLLANHKDGMFFLRGNEVKVKKGQIARAERTLAKRWRCSRDKVRRFLGMLKTRHQIRQQQGNVINILEIVNYEKYQQNETTDQTTERPQKNQYKNVKNEKKKDIVRPKDIQEVIDYFKERRIKYPKTMAEKFLAHYELVGWTYGKARIIISDWKLCVKTWDFEKEHSSI